jgi:hypothetical protein
MSGAGPDKGRGLSPRLSWGTPGFAMSGVAGSGAELETWYAIPPTRSTQRAPAMIQARRSEAVKRGRLATEVPQRWQNRARGLSSARHAAQARDTRLAPQLLQKFPAAPAPQLGQVSDDAIDMVEEA